MSEYKYIVDGYETMFNELKQESQKLKEALKVAVEALAFYSNKDHWMRSYVVNIDKEVLQPSNWADKLKSQDCAMLNCGGGRARQALSKIKALGIVKEGEK